jgi:Na+/glutamate symporter
MNNDWFKRWGWFYCPVSVPGGVLVMLALVFCVQVFVAVDRHSHSVSDAFYGVFPYFACCFLLFNWVASNTSGEKGAER